jgi:hypothetical protein
MVAKGLLLERAQLGAFAADLRQLVLIDSAGHHDPYAIRRLVEAATSPDLDIVVGCPSGSYR